MLSRAEIDILIFFYYSILFLPLCHLNDTWEDVEYHWQVLAGIVERECPNLAQGLRQGVCLVGCNQSWHCPQCDLYGLYGYNFFVPIPVGLQQPPQPPPPHPASPIMPTLPENIVFHVGPVPEPPIEPPTLTPIFPFHNFPGEHVLNTDLLNAAMCAVLDQVTVFGGHMHGVSLICRKIYTGNMYRVKLT